MAEIHDKDGRPTLYIHKDELIVPLSEYAKDVELDKKRELTPCFNVGKMYIGKCEECDGKVVKHCLECKQTINGCGCTMKEKVSALQEELVDRLFE